MLRKLNAGLDRALYAHWLNPEWLAEDAFDECFMKRGAEMLTLIGKAMGKEFTGGNGVFQNALIRAGLRPADQQHPLDLPEPQQFDDPDNYDDPLDEPVNDTDAAA